MNVFEAVKNAVNTRLAAEHYGLKVGRNGMACCPFHNDKNPSIKLDKRFHCFGCQADGDVIDYVSALFGLGKKEAAEKIAEDFGITYEKWKPPDQAHRRSKGISKAVRDRPIHELYSDANGHFWRALTDYYHLLCGWREEFAPTDPEEEWDERFVEALGNISQLEYIMDTFLEGDLETQVDIIIDQGRKIKDYERRVREAARAEAGGAETGDEGDGTGAGKAA